MLPRTADAVVVPPRAPRTTACSFGPATAPSSLIEVNDDTDTADRSPIESDRSPTTRDRVVTGCCAAGVDATLIGEVARFSVAVLWAVGKYKPGRFPVVVSRAPQKRRSTTLPHSTQ